MRLDGGRGSGARCLASSSAALASLDQCIGCGVSRSDATARDRSTSPGPQTQRAPEDSTGELVTIYGCRWRHADTFTAQWQRNTWHAAQAAYQGRFGIGVREQMARAWQVCDSTGFHLSVQRGSQGCVKGCSELASQSGPGEPRKFARHRPDQYSVGPNFRCSARQGQRGALSPRALSPCARSVHARAAGDCLRQARLRQNSW